MVARDNEREQAGYAEKAAVLVEITSNGAKKGLYYAEVDLDGSGMPVGPKHIGQVPLKTGANLQAPGDLVAEMHGKPVVLHKVADRDVPRAKALAGQWPPLQFDGKELTLGAVPGKVKPLAEPGMMRMEKGPATADPRQAYGPGEHPHPAMLPPKIFAVADGRPVNSHGPLLRRIIANEGKMAEQAGVEMARLRQAAFGNPGDTAAQAALDQARRDRGERVSTTEERFFGADGPAAKVSATKSMTPEQQLNAQAKKDGLDVDKLQGTQALQYAQSRLALAQQGRLPPDLGMAMTERAGSKALGLASDVRDTLSAAAKLNDMRTGKGGDGLGQSNVRMTKSEVAAIDAATRAAGTPVFEGNVNVPSSNNMAAYHQWKADQADKKTTLHADEKAHKVQLHHGDKIRITQSQAGKYTVAVMTPRGIGVGSEVRESLTGLSKEDVAKLVFVQHPDSAMAVQVEVKGADRPIAINLVASKDNVQKHKDRAVQVSGNAQVTILRGAENVNPAVRKAQEDALAALNGMGQEYTKYRVADVQEQPHKVKPQPTPQGSHRSPSGGRGGPE